MQKFQLIAIAIVGVILFFACEKDDEVCHGCGIDTTVKEYLFQVDGRILEDCSGKPAANRTLEFILFYKEDTLITLGQTNATGYFNFQYAQLLPGDYGMSSSWESYCLLKVKEDSVTFFLNGLQNHPGLDLQVGDSLDVRFYLNYNTNPFIAGDTISLRFEPPIMAGSYYPCIVGGPLQYHALIYTIKDKWRFVVLDDHDKPTFKFYTNLNRGSGISSTYGYSVINPKVSCVMSPQEIDYLLPN